MSLRICFVCAEYAPYAKTGGLGDVAAALTRQLALAGHDVLVVVPLHGAAGLTGADLTPVGSLQGRTLQVGPHVFHYDVRLAHSPGSGAGVHLIDCPALFDRPTIYTDGPDEHLRYLML